MGLLAVLALELDVEGLREVLAQLVGGAHLEGLAVAHERLDGERVQGPGEALGLGLDAAQHGQREHVLHEVGVDLVEDAQRERVGVLIGVVDGVALLPQELRGAQEQAGAQLVAHDVAPLVEQQGQVAVGVHPLRHVLADDGLGGGADRELLFELLAAAVRDHPQLGREALDVVGLAGEVGLGDEQGERGVLRAGLLDAGVHLGRHALPQGEAGRTDHLRAARRPVLCQLGLGDDVLVPARKSSPCGVSTLAIIRDSTGRAPPGRNRIPPPRHRSDGRWGDCEIPVLRP
nr:hypothetical protein GCM10025732_18850 [Glycomyces mayteni]